MGILRYAKKDKLKTQIPFGNDKGQGGILLGVVVGGFAGDDDVVDVGLAEAGV